jgi:hypothetical protein
VPESAERSAERKARAAARRREAVGMLRIGEATCRYAAAQLGNGGIGPDEARQTAAFVADELTVIADALRRLTRLGPAERRELAERLAALGYSQRQIAAQIGVADRCGRSCAADAARR